jgi:type IV fimbrial biogenesis protein FimT
MGQPADQGAPPIGEARRDKFSGFTIVELMVSLVLLSITLTLALPSYREMVEKRQLTQGAEQVFAFLNSAQGIASRSNSVVTVSYSRTDEDDWCFGAVLGSAACDCTETVSTEADFCEIDGGIIRLTNDHVGNTKIMESMVGDGAYAYDPVRGLMVDLNDSLDVMMYSPSDSYQLRLIVSNTGHAVMCSKDADHDIPGYKVCPAEP